MQKNLLFRLLFIALLLNLNFSGFAQKYHRIRMEVSKEKLENLFKKGLEIDHFDFHDNVLVAEVSDYDLKIIRNENLSVKFLIKDLAKNYQKVNKQIDKKNGAKNARVATTPAHFALGTYGGFFTFQEMQNILDQMRILYPNLISAKSSIGTSIEGRPLFLVKISDNPDVDEAEPELFLSAVHHAREPISMSQLIYYMWHILENYDTDPTIKTLLNSSELFILPCVNPDGYVYNQTNNPSGGGMWRKNRKNNGNGTFGTDLNRNYSYNWGYNNSGSSPTTSSDTYRGPSAFSEPETQAIRDFSAAHNFVSAMNFHSYGNYCIYPFGYATTNNNPEIALFSQMGAYLTAENSFTYGNSTQTVAYVANGTSDDWGYGEQTAKNKIYSFTPEVGASTDGFYPAQSRIIPLCESTLEMNKKLLKLSANYSELSSTSPSTTTGLNGTLNFSFKNFSLKNPSYGVSVSSTSPYVTSISAGQNIASMNLFQVSTGQFTYTLSPSTPLGSVIDFQYTINNGYDPVTKNVTIVYDCATPQSLQNTAISLNSTTISWAAVSGAGGYNYAYKPVSSSTWSSDVFTTALSANLTGLTQGTAYEWRVKTDICSNSSTSQFTTLLPCGDPTNLVSSSVTSSSALLSWTAAPNANSYQIEYKQNSSSTWIVANTAVTSTSFNLTGLLASSLYDWRIKSNCTSGNSAYFSGQFTTLVATVNYCNSKGNNISFFWMDYFKLSNVTRTSGADAGYYNGTANVANLVRGTNYTLTYSPGFTSTQYRLYWRVWIDYNKDGDFLDTGEQIMSTQTTGSGNYTFTFKPPTTASLGQTRIRVAMKYSAYSTSCETFTYGEVEDYTVNIAAVAGTELANARKNIEVNEEKMNNFEVKVYPNPAREELFIDFKNLNTENLKIKITDGKGQIKYEEILNSLQNGMGINVSNYAASIYFLTLEKENKKKTIKFIKE